MTALIRGETSECIQDYAQRFNIVDGLGLMAEFTGVKPFTVLAWMQGDPLPKGEVRIKLLCFLTLVGYKVEDYRHLPDVTQRLAQIIAFEVASVEVLMAELSYPSTHGLYSLILRGSGMLNDRGYRLEKLVTKYDELRRQAVTQWEQRVSAELMTKEPSGSEVILPPAAVLSTPVPPEPIPDLGPAAVAVLLSHSLSSLAVLIEELGKTSPASGEVAVAFVAQNIGLDRLEAITLWMKQFGDA